MNFTPIDLRSWPRGQMFYYFSKMAPTGYSITVNVDVTELKAAVEGRLLEQGYWFYHYQYTITPVLLMLPVFLLLGYAIPAVMYRQAAKQNVVERLRESE